MKKIIINENKREAELERLTDAYNYLLTEKANEGYEYGRSCSVYKDKNEVFYITDDESAPYVTKIGDKKALTTYFEAYA